MQIVEFDTTGAKNWLQQRGNALRAAGGNKAALDQHGIRLIANKLYQTWLSHLQANGQQGTPQELAAFISETYGEEHLQALSQQFPAVIAKPPPSAAPPASVEPAPGQAPLPSAASEDDHTAFIEFQDNRKKINQLFTVPNPDASQAWKLIFHMGQKATNEKQRGWLKTYIKQLKSNSTVMHTLPELSEIEDNLL